MTPCDTRTSESQGSSSVWVQAGTAWLTVIVSSRHSSTGEESQGGDAAGDAINTLLAVCTVFVREAFHGLELNPVTVFPSPATQVDLLAFHQTFWSEEQVRVLE